MKTKTRFHKLTAWLLTLAMFMTFIPSFTIGVSASEVTDKSPYEQMLEYIKPENNYGLGDISENRIFHAWGWSYQNIQAKLEDIAEQGFSTILVSPPNEIKMPTEGVKFHEPETDGISPNGWWMLYQPAGFQLNESFYNALGTKSEFVELCEDAHDLGFKIMVEAIVGYAGTDDDHIGEYDSVSTNPMDHVNPRMAEFEHELFAVHAFHSPWVNCTYKENYRDGYSDYDIEEDLTQHAVDGKPDLATEEQVVQDAIYDYFVELTEAGADGFYFNDAKHIETASDTFFASDFWQDTFVKVKDNYPDKNLQAVAELIGGSGDGRGPEEYLQYGMNLTHTAMSDTIRDGVVNGTDITAAFDEHYPQENSVLWGESYKSYANGETSALTSEQRAKIWALTVSRKGVKGIYLARPSNELAEGKDEVNNILSTITLGEGNVTDWSTEVVKRINHFAGFFEDTDENVHYDNGIAVIERDEKGAVLVNMQGNEAAASLSENSLIDGEYIDTITGNKFTVENGEITGEIGESGIAVLYLSKAIQVYELWVGGQQFTERMLTIEDGNSGTATYDSQTNTLTLNDINITSGYADDRERVIGIYADSDLTIELVGENNITMPGDNNRSYGIRVKGDLSISGSGSLNAVAGNVIAQDSTEHYSTGIYTGGHLNIYGATVYAKGGDIFSQGESYSCGVSTRGGLQLDFGGSLTAEGGNANGSMAYSTGLEALGDEEYLNISIYDGNLIAKGGDTEGVIVVESNGAYLELAGFYVYENTANVELTSGNAKVTSVDESEEPYACSNGITVYEGDIALHGGTIDISGGTWEGIDGDGWAVYVDGEESEDGAISGGNVLIKWENIELSPSGYGFIEPKVTITSTDEEKGAIFAGTGLEIGDKLIMCHPEGGKVAEIEEEDYAFNTILNSDDSLAKNVVIEPLIHSVKIEGTDYGMSVLVPNNTSINEAYKDMLENSGLTDFSEIINTEKSGYNFDGFYTESGEKFNFDNSVNGDMTITAKWTKKSYGGGSSSTTTTTKKNDDGSTTKTTTNKKTGTVTETTTYPDGSTTKVETKKDGTVTTTEKDKDGNTTTTVEKSDGTSTTTEKNKDGSENVTEKSADGTTVTTEKNTDGTKTVTTENADGSTTTEETKKDGTKVTTETNADGETKAEIDLPKNKETEVTIPVTDAEDVTSITVADKDGKKTEITDFEITEDGVNLTISGDCTAVINKAAKKEFADVHPINHWSAADIDYSYIKGLMMGTSENHFSPDVPLTRAMLVTVLYRLEGEPATNRSIPFADIDMGAYYGNAVSWAKQNGIVNGVTETEFAPNSNITREQIAAIMHRYAQYKGYDVSVEENTNILSYDDFDTISEYAIASMQYAVGSGLMKGKSASTLNPLDNATRAEIAAILHRFIEANIFWY